MFKVLLILVNIVLVIGVFYSVLYNKRKFFISYKELHEDCDENTFITSFSVGGIYRRVIVMRLDRDMSYETEVQTTRGKVLSTNSGRLYLDEDDDLKSNVLGVMVNEFKTSVDYQ